MPYTSLRAAASMPAGGFVKDDDLGTGGQGAGDDHLLLVAARQAADEVVQRDDLGAELVGILL